MQLAQLISEIYFGLMAKILIRSNIIRIAGTIEN